MKKCPFCSEKIQNEASLCKHCKQDLTTPHARELAYSKMSYLERKAEEARRQRESKKQLRSFEGGQKLYEKKWLRVFCLIFCFPIGIVLILMNEFHKRKIQMQSLSPEDKKAITKKNLIVLGWLGFCVVLLFVTALSPYFAFLILTCTIWLYPRKGEVIFKNRLVECQNHKARMIFTVISLVFFTWVSSSLKEIRFIQQYPSPQVQIISSQGTKGNNLEYLLEISAKDYTEIRVNSRLMQASDDGKLQMTIELDKPETAIKIVAKNAYKTTKKEIVVSRNETEEEAAKRLAKKEENRIKAEEVEKAKLAESKKQKEIQAEELREYKEIQKNKAITKLQSELENVRNFTGGKHYESIEGLNFEVTIFASWVNIINEGKASEYEEAQNLAQQVEQELKNLQIREFPKMRKAYGKIAEQMLWEHDVYVKVFGNANGTIEIVGHWFTENKIIKDSHNEIREMLHRLRFDKANYRWAEGRSGTSFTLESKPDAEF